MVVRARKAHKAQKVQRTQDAQKAQEVLQTEKWFGGASGTTEYCNMNPCSIISLLSSPKCLLVDAELGTVRQKKNSLDPTEAI